jgi:hypothetical protein
MVCTAYGPIRCQPPETDRPYIQRRPLNLAEGNKYCDPGSSEAAPCTAASLLLHNYYHGVPTLLLSTPQPLILGDGEGTFSERND